MKEFRNPSTVRPPRGPYTHQIELHGDERLLCMSGQLGVRLDGTVPDDVVEQIGIAFDNLFRNLEAADMGVADIIKLNYYIVGFIEEEKRAAMILSKLQGNRPCSTLVYVAGLAQPKYKVEIEAWASKSN